MFEKLEGEALVQVYARLNMHELLLELIWTDGLAMLPPERREEVLAELSGRWKRAWVAGVQAIDDERAFAITSTASELLERFANKIRMRLAGAPQQASEQ